MKKPLIFGIGIIILAAGLWFFFYQSKINISQPTPSPVASSPAQDAAVYCTPQQLQAQIDSEGAAGNIYATVTIENISNADCQIIGNNNIELQYGQSIKNIKITSQNMPTFEAFTLTPNQTVYSQIRYPNGPQCSGTPKQASVVITYKISPANSITFRALDGQSSFSIPTCTSLTEITTIDIWPISTKSVNQ